eukprot:3931509-Prymnesium_polylepis.1
MSTRVSWLARTLKRARAAPVPGAGASLASAADSTPLNAAVGVGDQALRMALNTGGTWDLVRDLKALLEQPQPSS